MAEMSGCWTLEGSSACQRSLTSVGVQSPRAFGNVPEPVGAAPRVMTASTYGRAATYLWLGGRPRESPERGTPAYNIEKP